MSHAATSQVDAPTVPICPLCGEASTVFVGKKADAAGLAEHDYYRCEACELIFAAAIPTPEMFAAIYQGHFTRRNVAWKTLKLVPLMWYARRRMRARGAPGPLKFLDIGSNAGYTTEGARRLGCEAHGLELDLKAVAFARQHHPKCAFHAETLEIFAQRKVQFDIVFCSEVIEHVTDIHAFVKALRDVSHAGTILFLTTPDSGHYKVPRDLIGWDEIIPVQHLRVFNKRNLADLLARHGFRIDFSFFMVRANQRHFCSPVAMPSP